MKLKKTSMFWRISAQRGISLLELMVALAIGLVLILALATLMVVANRSSMNRSTAELLDETARQVFSRLEADFKQAGYVDPFADDRIVKEVFDLSDKERMARYIRQKDYLTAADKNQLSVLGKLTSGNVQPIKGCSGKLSRDGKTCTPDPGSKWHSIQIAYQVVKGDRADPLSSTSSVKNEDATESNALFGCANRKATEENPIILNQYYFDDADRKNEVTAARNLRCDTALAKFSGDIDTGAKRSEDPVVEGVEQMVFRYLVTTSDATGKDDKVDFDKIVSGRSVEKYLTAEEVEKEDLGWASVVGVEVCLIVAVQPVDGRKDSARSSVQPNVPNCLRDAKSTTANASFDPDTSERPRNWADYREYRRYVRIFSLPGSMYIGHNT